MSYQKSSQDKHDQIISLFPICHRLPDRTFNFKGHYFPVCARCTGFYIGAFSYFTYVHFFYVQYTILILILAFLMLTPTFLDGFTQLVNLRESTNNLRLFTGIFGGIGIAIFLKALKWIILVNI